MIALAQVNGRIRGNVTAGLDKSRDGIADEHVIIGDQHTHHSGPRGQFCADTRRPPDT